MQSTNLSENDKQQIIDFIKQGKPLPKEYIYKLYADDEDVFLFWNGRSETVTNAVLPFHSIEHIDEPRKEVEPQQATLFDTTGRQLKGWTNKLIWGDNKLILSSLVNGPLREEIEKQDGLKLIYIDPPFAVGADFSYNIKMNGEDVTKQQSVIEEIAYRDTWGRGISSYLSMMYERLKLMHQLLAEDGSIYEHCDWRVASYIKFILDDIFGIGNLNNEIIWSYFRYTARSNDFQRMHDNIFKYSKSDHFIFNQLYEEYQETTLKYHKWERDKDGKEFYWKRGKSIEPYKIYKSEGVALNDVWKIPQIGPIGSERVGFPTQKPEVLLSRIIRASSNEGDLVADFFCDSGTTAAEAEKLGRKWIACDLGRFAIHTTRKRMIGVQRELKKGQALPRL